VIASSALPLPRAVLGGAVAAAAVVATGLMTFAGAALPNPITAHVLTFYAVTAGAYLALPFVRRGDVVMGGMWLVLAAGVAPCVTGQEISAAHMFADMAGVLMAAAPIYIARLRQIAQGDTRDRPRRRQIERETARPESLPLEAETAG
jgi:hypothetical protein